MYVLQEMPDGYLVDQEQDDKDVVDISVASALLFLVMASGFLLLLYKFMSDWFLLLLVILFCIGGVEVGSETLLAGYGWSVSPRVHIMPHCICI